MTDASPRPWRTGTSPAAEGLTVYSHEGDTPRGTLLGMYRRPEDAARAVEAVNAYGEPGPGDHVLVTVDPARNRGAASISRRMVPLYAPIGNMLAGDTVDTVREEYDLTAGEVRLVAALAEEIRGFLSERDDSEGDEPPPAELGSCHPEQVVVDGQHEVIRVHADGPMSSEARAAFGEVVAAARRHVAATNPHLGVIQELLAAVRIAAWCIPDGTVHTRFGLHNGADVKARLRTAVKDAQTALSPPKPGEDGPTEGGQCD